MKFHLRRRLAIAWIAALIVVVAGKAQNPADKNPSETQSKQDQAAPVQHTAPEPMPAPSQKNKPAGKVIFQRSLDDSGNTVSTTAADAKASANGVDAPVAEDAERSATAVTRLDLDVRLNAGSQQIAVRGSVTVRNGGDAPLKRVPLQISSSLNWGAGSDGGAGCFVSGGDGEFGCRPYRAVARGGGFAV